MLAHTLLLLSDLGTGSFDLRRSEPDHPFPNGLDQMSEFENAHTCLSNRFFGEWFAEYDPLKNDAITGPIEEFRTNGGLGQAWSFTLRSSPNRKIHSYRRPKSKARISSFVDSVGPRKGVSGYLTGYSDKASDSDFKVENTNTKVAIRQTSDHPLSRLYFWSTRTTICPEGYIHLNLPPGQTGRWKINYQFICARELRFSAKSS